MAMAPSQLVPDLAHRTTPQAPSQDLRNPLPLSSKQEAEVRDVYHRKVRALCAPEIAAFAACARGRTVSLAWACKPEQLAMNSCMIQHAADKRLQDEAREEWFSGVLARRRKAKEEHEAVEKRRQEVVEMIRRQEQKEKAEAESQRLQKERGAKQGRAG
ncbi:hypothetical protein DV737_g2100, partial [Chaetothyriales sp. CBS 132003]